MLVADPTVGDVIRTHPRLLVIELSGPTTASALHVGLDWRVLLFTTILSIACGVGFGLGFAVVFDPPKTLIPCSKGEFYWGGAASTAASVTSSAAASPSTESPTRIRPI